MTFEQVHNIHISVGDSNMKGASAIRTFAVHIGSVKNEELGNFLLVPFCRFMQRSVALAIGMVNGGPITNQQLGSAEVTLFSGPMQS